MSSSPRFSSVNPVPLPERSHCLRATHSCILPSLLSNRPTRSRIYSNTMNVEEDGTIIKLISRDGYSFPVSTAMANMSEAFKKAVMGPSPATTTLEIHLPNVKAQVLQKVIEFCMHHLVEPMTEIEKPIKSTLMVDNVSKWYADFVDHVEQALLFELILAAHAMGIQPLFDLTCAKVASMIRGKTPQQIRETFIIASLLEETQSTADPSLHGELYPLDEEEGEELHDIIENNGGNELVSAWLEKR